MANSQTTPEEESAWAEYQKSQTPIRGPWSSGDQDLPRSIQALDQKLDRSGLSPVLIPAGGGLSITESAAPGLLESAAEEASVPHSRPLFQGKIKNFPPPNAPLFQPEMDIAPSKFEGPVTLEQSGPKISEVEQAPISRALKEGAAEESTHHSGGLIHRTMEKIKNSGPLGGLAVYGATKYVEPAIKRGLERAKEGAGWAAGLLPQSVRDEAFSIARKVTGSSEDTTPEEEAAWAEYQKTQRKNPRNNR